MKYTYIPSPIGRLMLASDGEAITGLTMEVNQYGPEVEEGWQQDDELPLFKRAKTQLEEYFAGKRTTFDLPLKMIGTDFQKRVWQELERIPFGETISYQELAKRVGSEKASRAVGQANGHNPVSIFVPCHRVINASGKLGGYGGGLPRKEFLLELEQKQANLFSHAQ
ncbi:MAG: methylated-DNA--[protein]-cysteine S-methyltransferase [Armatimonadetes bacterium]|nr:methylated-DNA--[protein]-cysteine S-methyltransferase [Armatimonadota bacterium]